MRSAPPARRTVLATGLLLVALVAVLLPSRVRAQSPTSCSRAGLGEVRSMAISPGDMPQSAMITELSRIRNMGINTVSLDVWWVVEPGLQNTVVPASANTDVDVAQVSAAARQLGMNVVLILKLRVPGGGWRGAIKPSDPDAFFDSYRNFVTHFAVQAQSDGICMLFIGSEMNSLQDNAYTGQWTRLVGAARARGFTGLIGYVANWDHFADLIHELAFAPALDVIGISAYFPLSDNPDPSPSELQADWHASSQRSFRGYPWFRQLEAIAQATGKPIFFAEAGYLSYTSAAAYPYANRSEDGASGGVAGEQVQWNGYQGLLQTFEHQPWWMGVNWWQWDPGPVDSARTPRGKLAEGNLTRWYLGGGQS